MNPGRELDKMVAEVVFGSEVEFLNQKAGWRIDFVAKNKDCNDTIYAMEMADGYRLKNFSTDISAAWDIVEKLGRNGTQWRFSNKAFSNTYWWVYTEDAVAQGDTLPHAICLAAIQHIKGQAK